MQNFTVLQPVCFLKQSIIATLCFLLLFGSSIRLNAQVYSANFNSNIQSWVNGSSNSWSRVSTGGVSNSGCLTSTIVCEEGQQQGSCINETNYFIATPSVSLTGGNTYQISIKCSVATASTRKLVLGVNTSQARSGATTLQNFGYVSTGGYTAFTVNYTPTSSGSPYFVLWGEKNLTQTVGLWLDDFAVTLVNSAPTVSLTNPDNNSVYVEGDSPFLFKASVSDAENNLSKVEFFSNGTKVGERTSTPLSITYIPTVGGTYSLTAKATDSYGASTTSAARSISFRTRPMISFVTPDIEYSSYAEGPLDLEVNASDADGTVSSVKFYIDDNLVFNDATSPWVYNWTATPGSHTFLAVGTDNQGLESASNFELVGFDVVANTCSLSVPTSSSTTICEGASATFTSGYSSLLTGTIQWQRQPTGGSWANISGATSASYSATLAGNYRGVWTFENGATCTTTSKTLLVAPNPTVTVAPVTVYGNEPALAVAVASGGTAPYTYSWSTGSCEGISPCDSVMISNFNNPVTVSVLDVNGCGVLDTVSLTHCHSISLSNTGANYSDISPGSELFTQYQAICAGNFVQLHAQTSSGFEGALSWFKNGNLIDGYISDSLIESPDSATIYKVSIPSTSTCESRYAQINVKVINTQTNFTFDSLHCHAHLIDSLAPTLSAFLLSPGAAQGTTQFSQGSLVSYSPTYTTTGRYNLTYIVTDGNYGCSTTNYLHANWSDFKVQVPPVYVNHALTSYGIAVGSLGQPFANPDKYKYEWFKNGVHFADGQQMSAPDTLGPYYAIGTDSLGCNASDTLTYVYRDMYSTRSIWAKNQTYSSATLHWDDKTSEKHFVIIREGKRPNFVPEQGKGYAANPEFGVASLGSGHFGLFNGQGGEVEITGLAPNKKYYVSAFAWKIVDGDTLWDTTSVCYQLKAKAIPTPTSFNFYHSDNSSVTIKLPRFTDGNILVIGQKDSLPVCTPVDSVIYSSNNTFNVSNNNYCENNYILYDGPDSDSLLISDLDSGKNYVFNIFNKIIIDNVPYYSKYSRSLSIELINILPSNMTIFPDEGYSFSKCKLIGNYLGGIDGIKVGDKICRILKVTFNEISFRTSSGSGDNKVFFRKNNQWYDSQLNFNYILIPPNASNFNCKDEFNSNSTASIDPNIPLLPPKTYYGNRNTPSGELNVLVVFTREASQSAILESTGAWPYPDEVPQDFGLLSYSNFDEFHPDNEDFTLSNFYYQMSKDNPVLEPFKVIFRPFPLVIIRNHPTKTYKKQIEDFFEIEENNYYEGYLEKFDSRETGGSYDKNNIISQSDEIFDMEIHFQGGSSWNVGMGGSANGVLGIVNFSAFGKNYTLGQNAVNIQGYANWPFYESFGTIAHELSHFLFNSPHVFFNNGVVGSHFTASAGWGTMNTNSLEHCGFNYRANAFESWLLGWKKFHTISNQADALLGPFLLHDFTRSYSGPFSSTAFDGLRIRVPSNVNGAMQNLWITNHLGNNFMDNPIHNLHDANGVSQDQGKGVYIMMDEMGIDNYDVAPTGLFGKAGSLKFLDPFGGLEYYDIDYSDRPDLFSRFGFRTSPNLSVARLNSFSDVNRTSYPRLKTPFQDQDRFRFSTNPNNGVNDLVFPRYLDGQLNRGFSYDKWPFANNDVVAELGLNFNTSVFNYQTYNYIKQDFSPIILNGLYIKVFPKDLSNQSEQRKIDVKYDHNKFEVDKNISGHFNIVDLQDLSDDIIIGSNKTLVLDRSINPNRTSKGTYYSVSFVDNQIGWVVGDNGTVQKTVDGGRSWQLQLSGVRKVLRSVFFKDNSNGWIVGDNGLILKTINGGANWLIQNSGTHNDLFSVFFVNPQTGWAVGANGTILVSTDGGQNWANQNAGSSIEFRSVHFIDEQVGLVAGASGLILKTSNGGQTWITQNSGTTNSLFSLHFIDQNKGWAVGEGGITLKTNNGGINWNEHTIGGNPLLHSVQFINDQIGYAVSGNGRVFMTYSGGNSWSNLLASAITLPLYSLSFTNASTGWLIGEGALIYKTTNSGASWLVQRTDSRNSLYPDLITPSRLVCKSGSRFVLESNATFLVDNESGFEIESGANIVLEQNAKIVVRSGCTFIINSGANISASSGASIIVEDQTYYCISSSVGILPSQLQLGYRLGSVSPKLQSYLGKPTNCIEQQENFMLGFQCNSNEEAIVISGNYGLVDLYKDNSLFDDLVTTPILLSSLSDGHYSIRPHSPQSGNIGIYSTSFDLFGQSGSLVWNGQNRSFSNILVLKSNLSVTSGKITLEPNCQVFIRGAPVNTSNCLGGNCTPSVSGGDVTLSGTARMDVRDGVKFQGMCNSMWGGISISDHAGLTAYNNMIFRDSYDGISTLANEDNSDLIQLHVFNAKFENNYRSIKQTDAIESFNFVRNCTFTSDENQMKQPFDRPGATSCVKYISNTHLEYEHCLVNQGNFWNNTISKAQTGLKISNNSRGFYSVLNTFNNNYGKSIHLHNGSGVPTNFDRNVVNLPSDFLFCSHSQEGPSDYIFYQTPYAKYGIYVEGSGNLPVITNTTISGPGFGTTGGVFRNVGIYSHGASSLSLSQSTLQNLNYGLVFYGSQTSGTPLNNVKENNFINNEQNLRFKSNYQANHKLTLKCNKFTTPTSPDPFTMRYGIFVEEGAEMPDIGGTGLDNNPLPSANSWPVGGTNNSTISPWPVTQLSGGNVNNWYSPTSWRTVHTATNSGWKYYGYKNEFIGNWLDLSSNQLFEFPPINRIVRSNPNQMIPANQPFDDACANFGQLLVFPTRIGVSQDSVLTEMSGIINHSKEAFLWQNIPNPASQTTVIPYFLPNGSKGGKLEIFELTSGRIVKSIGIPIAGKGQLEFSLQNFVSGIYGYRLLAEGKALDWKKMIVIH